MICDKCGAQNALESKFCIKCGNNLKGEQLVQNQGMDTNSLEPTIKMSMIEYLSFIIAVLLKPYDALKKEIYKFNSIKNSAILALIVSVIATIIKVISTMLSTVRETSYFSETVTWAWENLKEINYIKLIGTNFFVYLGIIVAIAVIYYIISLMLKKQVDFPRLLGISAVSLAPFLGAIVVSPLASMLYAPLGLWITTIALVYTIVIIYEAMNQEVQLTGNIKFYYNLVCLSILIFVVGYLYTKGLITTMASDASEFLDLFQS